MDLKKKLRPRRSFIFTPGLRPEMFPKAVKSGVDMVCIELEDGIAPKDKKEAREKALSIFQNQTIPENIEVILRINSIRSLFGLDDIRAILSTDFPPPAIMLPKVNDAE